jgi:hypothetical protein
LRVAPHLDAQLEKEPRIMQHAVTNLWGAGFRFRGSWFRILALGFRIEALGFGI